jgi:D-alanyl-D-alanine carboxypeptidase (penicillin-binding protein 5/6)
MQITKHEKGLLVLLIIFALVGVGYYTETKKRADAVERARVERIEKELALKMQVEESLNALDTLAKSISVYDIDTQKVIYGKNAELKMPLASLAKTMTVMVALDKNVDDYIKITPEFLKEEGEYNLVDGEIWDVKNLARFALILSSNDAAAALTRGDKNFVTRMNEKARQIGLSNTEFSNVTGLDMSENIAGVYGTADDANKMAAYAILNYGEVFESTVWPALRVKSESGYTHDIVNTNLIIKEVPSIIFSKTGFTELAGGNLTVIFNNAYAHRLAVTLLGSTMQGRFDDMEKIVKALYNLQYEI